MFNLIQSCRLVTGKKFAPYKPGVVVITASYAQSPAHSPKIEIFWNIYPNYPRLDSYSLKIEVSGYPQLTKNINLTLGPWGTEPVIVDYEDNEFPRGITYITLSGTAVAHNFSANFRYTLLDG